MRPARFERATSASAGHALLASTPSASLRGSSEGRLGHYWATPSRLSPSRHRQPVETTRVLDRTVFDLEPIENPREHETTAKADSPRG